MSSDKDPRSGTDPLLAERADSVVFCGGEHETPRVSLREKIFRATWGNYVCVVLAAAVSLSATCVLVKLLTDRFSVFQVTLVRGSVTAIVTGAYCRKYDVPLFGPDSVHRPTLFLRCFLGVADSTFTSLSVHYLPLTISSFLINSNPIVTALFSWILRMEPVRALVALGLAGTLAGETMVAEPPIIFGGKSEDWDMDKILGIVFAIATSVSLGLLVVSVRKLGQVALLTQLFVYSVIMTVTSIPFVLLSFPGPFDLSASLSDVALYILYVSNSAITQFLMAHGFRIGPPTKTSTLFLSNIVMTAIVGVVAFSEHMSSVQIVGAVVLLISIAIVNYKQHSEKLTSTPVDPNKNPRPIVVACDAVDDLDVRLMQDQYQRCDE